MKQALIIIDMQQGSFTRDAPKHDAEGLVKRLNRLAEGVRASSIASHARYISGSPKLDLRTKEDTNHLVAFLQGAAE